MNQEDLDGDDLPRKGHPLNARPLALLVHSDPVQVWAEVSKVSAGNAGFGGISFNH